MYKIEVKSSFSAAHNLRGYKGKCEDLHGHNWNVQVGVSSADLNELGMVADFKEVKEVLASVVTELDHKYLNDVERFREVNPTSENIARYVFERIRDIKPEWKLEKVTVWETGSSAATYGE